MVASKISTETEYLLDLCKNLDLEVKVHPSEAMDTHVALVGPGRERITVEFENPQISLIEQVLSQMDFDFEKLPLLVRGDSKEIRLLTPKIALAKLIPTVYSYTYNRYGIAPGTEVARIQFTADIFRKMANEPGPFRLASAFLGLVKSKNGLLLAEQVVDSCNIEVRVKRFHIGSPLHRYLYTDQHHTRRNEPPLQRWARFEKPIVCFDWRHPLHDEQGERLADEPLPDDYAALWLDDIDAAKELARDTFLWLEEQFSQAGLLLVDICFFIDRTGKVLYGEISPDCMRVRDGTSADAEALDKDFWRSGGDAEEVAAKYWKLHGLIFDKQSESRPSQKKEAKNNVI